MSPDDLRFLGGLCGAAEAQLVHKTKVLHREPVLPYAPPASRVKLGQNVRDLHGGELLHLDPSKVRLRKAPATRLNLVCHRALQKRDTGIQIKLLYCIEASETKVGKGLFYVRTSLFHGSSAYRGVILRLQLRVTVS
eukprot:XP_001708027.1 Hypothetical protein GL50803_31994 [Giardia lamblia ATCC 50803]